MSEHTPWATNLRNENAKLIADNKRLREALKDANDSMVRCDDRQHIKRHHSEIFDINQALNESE